MSDILNYLRQSKYFTSLKDEDLNKLIPYFHSESFPSGEIILQEGGPADRFYLITAGQVEIWKNLGVSAEVKLADYGVGNLFGELSVIDDEPRSASVIAASDCDLLCMSKDDFYRLTDEYPGIMLAILRGLSRMIRSSNRIFIDSLNTQNRELQQALVDLREAQEELIKAERFSNLGKLAGLVIHDLKNPLSIIKGYAEMLQVLDDNPEQISDFARKIVRETGRISRFSQELLDYTRGDMRLNWVLTNNSRLMMRMQPLLENLERQNIELKQQVSGDYTYFIDEDRMERALGNLIDNSVKAMPDGGKLFLNMHVDEKYLRISVQDNGAGMGKAVLSHIFEPFFSKSNRGGTGLGMVSVKLIVEAHQGTVEVSSSEGEGTTVSLEIPRYAELPD